MKKFWYSYQSKFNRHQKDLSITNDEVALLAERLEFFIPKMTELLSLGQWLLYIVLWSFFVTLIHRNTMATWLEFIPIFIFQLSIHILTILPCLILIDFFRPKLKHLDNLQACAWVWLIVIIVSILTSITVQQTANYLGFIDLQFLGGNHLLLNALFHALISGCFAITFLLYLLERHRELSALKVSFEQKLSAQNDLIKARIAPHSFFNTINTLMSLMESDSEQASKLLQHISVLFRTSFYDPKEISFDEEVSLCQHYLAIEKSRLGEKLVVEWDLPDEDTLYDMVITALTVQRVLEQMLLHIVEMTTKVVSLVITARWENHLVNIEISARLPQNTLLISQNLQRQMDFRIQAERLKLYFGNTAQINSYINNQQVKAIINYPLHDAGLS